MHVARPASRTLIERLVSPPFVPQNILILSKTTRLSYERQTLHATSERELVDAMDQRGSNYTKLLARHKSHSAVVTEMAEALSVRPRCEVKVVTRSEYSPELIQWADLIVAAGGDGHYLHAASLAPGSDTPIVGYNTDPSGSQGHLCLPVNLTMPDALDRIASGQYRWLDRQRLSLKMTSTQPIVATDLHNHNEPLPQMSVPAGEAVVLPAVALNEIFIGESRAAMVSYYEVSIDGSAYQKQKSSGVTVCTGTGSSSWFYSINFVHEQTVRDVLRLASAQLPRSVPPVELEHMVHSVTAKVNRQLVFPPEEPLLAYSIRDPIMNEIFDITQPAGFAKTIKVRSRMEEGTLVIDGGIAYEFNTGSVAELAIAPDRPVRTMVLHEGPSTVDISD